MRNVKRNFQGVSGYCSNLLAAGSQLFASSNMSPSGWHRCPWAPGLINEFLSAGPALCGSRKDLHKLAARQWYVPNPCDLWKQALINSDQTNAYRSQHSESISYRHAKVRTSKVSHRVTHSSQFVVLMTAGRERKCRKRGKHKKEYSKWKTLSTFAWEK